MKTGLNVEQDDDQFIICKFYVRGEVSHMLRRLEATEKARRQPRMPSRNLSPLGHIWQIIAEN